ncbi:site-specific integrase [Clostridium estertheticum]|nr:site-specific integrase [Clostridium estertheticum]
MGMKLKIKLDESITFEKGFEEYLDNCKARNLRKATITHYEEGYKAVTKYIDKEMNIGDINQSTVSKFIIECNKTNVSSQTLYTYTRDFKTILYFFMRMGYLKEFNIKLPKLDKKAIETYTDAELKKLLKKPDLKHCTFVEYRDWTIINFLLSTAVRLSSFTSIKIKDLDFENEVVYINITKNRNPLIIPLNATIIKILKGYLKIRQYKSTEEYLFCTAYNKRLVNKSINGSLIKYNRDRGVMKTGIHRYRHTFAKKFIIKGGSPVILQKILGHSSLLITENYLNILVTDIKNEMSKFDILSEFNNNTHIKIHSSSENNSKK